MRLMPPTLPPESIYTSCWCEENIYLLAQTFLKQSTITDFWDPFVIFISNETKTVAVWNQKPSKDGAIVWDYHVVLLIRLRDRSTLPVSHDLNDREAHDVRCWVYDFDSRLNMPCSWKEYLLHTFSTTIPRQYQSLFRVVPGGLFVDCFASDRSHMLSVGSDGSEYISPPPEYHPVCGPKVREAGITNNLMSGFVSMVNGEGTYGDVFEMDEFIRYIDV